MVSFLAAISRPPATAPLMSDRAAGGKVNIRSVARRHPASWTIAQLCRLVTARRYGAAPPAQRPKALAHRGRCRATTARRAPMEGPAWRDDSGWVGGRLVPVDKLEVHRRGLCASGGLGVPASDGARTLLQRRALGKYHTPGLWANACCTHPRWGEDAAACAARRLREELGVAAARAAPPRPDRLRAPRSAAGWSSDERGELFAADAPTRTWRWRPTRPR